MAKKFYWLKLMKDFFAQPKMKKLRRIAGGDTYTIIYLKMQLISLEHDGVIVYEHVEDSFIEEVALTIDEDAENVAVTVQFLMRQGLMEQLEDDTYLMVETQKLIGSEGESAERVRKLRAKKKEREALQSNGNVLQSNGAVTDCNTEIETEKEKELEIETEKEKDKEAIAYVIEYLNLRAGTHYRSTTEKTKKCIRARLREGYQAEDFEAVIDTKCNEWMGTEWQKFLRPETLFGTKFEGYLNQGALPVLDKRPASFMDLEI